MSHRLSTMLLLIVCMGLFAACGGSEATQAPVRPTATTEPERASPTPTPVSAFAIGATIAGVDVGGLEPQAAAEQLETLQEDGLPPLTIQAGDERLRMRPADIDMTIPVDDLLNQARDQHEAGDEVEVALQVRFDEGALRQQLNDFAQTITVAPQLQILSDTETLSRTFAYQPGTNIDVDETLGMVEDYLAMPDPSARAWRIDAPPQADPQAAIPRPTSAQLQQQIEELAAEWEGIVGLYLHDLESGETLSLNEDTVFSAASVIKVGILLHATITLDDVDPEVQAAIEAMIIDSDNLAANDVLAATVGGIGTDAAYEGALALNEFLAQLGLQHTYMNMPFEAYDYLVGLRGLSIAQGPPQEGSPPYTKPDTILRTTPAEISRIFLLIDNCSQGTGELLERYPEQLTTDECQAILDLLARNADNTRMAAVIPEGVRVEHKSGWTQFMHADVGLVRSPGGDYLLAVYLWRDVEELPDVWANPYIQALSHLVYTAYNPVDVSQMEP